MYELDVLQCIVHGGFGMYFVGARRRAVLLSAKGQGSSGPGAGGLGDVWRV